MSDNNNKKSDPGNNSKKSDPNDLSEQYNPNFDIDKEPDRCLPAYMQAEFWDQSSHMIHNGYNGLIDNNSGVGGESRRPSWNWDPPEEDDESSATKDGCKDGGKNEGQAVGKDRGKDKNRSHKD